MPKSEARKERTRAALLGAARSLFAERGFEDTTIAAIGERAGLGFGTFYLYFKDKEAILDAVVTDGLTALRTQVDGQVAQDPDLFGAAGSMLRTIFRFAYANVDLFRVLLATSTGRQAVDAQQVFRNRVAETLTVFMGGQDAQIVSRMVAGVVSQAILWWFEHDEPGPDEMAERVQRFVLYGLFGQPRSAS